MWDLTASATPLGIFTHGGGMGGAILTRDGTQLITWGQTRFKQKGGAVRIWDSAAPQRPKGEFSFERPVIGVVLSRDEQRFIAWTERSGLLSIWDLAHKRPLAAFSSEYPIRGALFTPDENGVVFWGEGKDVVVRTLDPDLSRTLDDRLLDYQVRSGSEVAPDGSVRTLSLAEFQRRATKLHGRRQ